MFCFRCSRRKKKHQVTVVVGDELSSTPQQSVTTEQDPGNDTVLPNTQATSAAAVSAPPEAPSKKVKKTSWWRRFCKKVSLSKKDTASSTTQEEPEGEEQGVQDVSPASNTAKDESEGEEQGVQDFSPASNTAKDESEGEEQGVQDVSPASNTAEDEPEGEEQGVQDVSPASNTAEDEPEGEEHGVQDVSPASNTAKDEPAGEEQEVQDVSPASNTAKEEPKDEEHQVQEASPTTDTTKEEAECGEAGAQEITPNPDAPASAAPQTDTPKKKKPWWRRLFSRRKKKKLEKDHKEEEETSPPAESSQVHSDLLPTDAPELKISHILPAGHGGSQQAETTNVSPVVTPPEKKTPPVSTEPLPAEELVCLGFPNLAQTCYMNSTLQGLLTLTPFVQEVHSQQQVWRSHPESDLFRGLVDVGFCRFINIKKVKRRILAAFKRTVAHCNFEFKDDSQKDAHEFLSCVLGGLMSLSFDLHAAAIGMGCSYTCPVGAHMAFNMLSIRTCKGCGSQSMREEDFLNLSLDLACGGSVSQCLHEYLKETQLEFRCDCDAKESSQRWSFLTLPNVLILQLQRFRFTPSFSLEKVDSPVAISRELMVNPESCVTEETSTRYSLVSIISHLGSSAHSGHYICDGANRRVKTGEDTDRWLTYNDEDVTETTGKAVSLKRRRTAYLLLYEKQQ